MKRNKSLTWLTALFMCALVGFSHDAKAGDVVDATPVITWPHNTADDPIATYSDALDVYFKQDYVALGSNLFYKDVRDANGVTWRRYQPLEQSGSSAENVVGFHVIPVTGLSFVPTEVKFKAQRFGTDGGMIDVVWKSSDGTETVLKSSVKPLRDNSGTYNDETIDLSGVSIPASTGDCELQLILYDLGNTKQAGFADVIVKGKLTGTVIDVETFNLTTSVVPELAGSIEVSPVGTVFDSGTEVSVTASKEFGYAFSHWADGADQQVSTDNPYTFTMSADVELKAVFDVVPTYALNVSTAGGANDYMVSYLPEGTMVDGLRMYEEGINVTMTAVNNPVLTFANWSSGETSTDLTVNMNEEKNITAYYSALDFVVGWDFYERGNSGRVADFYSKDENQSSALILRTADGTQGSWLDKSTVAAGGYETAAGAAVNWRPIADKYYYQIAFNATDFTDMKVQAGMMYNYNAYAVQKVEYSLDNENWTTLGTITLEAAKTLYPGEFSLPEAANNQAMVYVRWIPDYTSSIVGSSSDNDGTVISAIYVTGQEELVNDGVPPVLENSVPAEGAENASATGRIVLNFDERVQVAEGATASLGNKTLTPVVSGRTIIFNYTGLEYSSEYTFTIAAGLIMDLTDNAMTESISITFNTLTRPEVTKKAYDFIVGVDGDFSEALAAANAASSSGNRFYIFFPNGSYDIGSLTGDANQMTTISIPNVSYIGESADGVIIYNSSINESINSTATIYLTSSSDNIYMQDLTLRNEMDWRKTLKGRGVALWDKGNKNIFKNVYLQSNQDTYYTGNERSYWEGGVIHGTVDFICGGGDIFFNETTIYLEERGGNCITAPATSGDWGYVFNSCTIDGFSSENGNFRLGRPWSNVPKAVYLNTVMKLLPTAEGWGDPMNVVPAVFAEYNSKTESGALVDLSGRRTTYTKDNTTVTLEPVLTSKQASTYTVDNVVGGTDNWQPYLSTEQAGAPDITGDGIAISWDNSNYVLGWAILKDGAFVDFVTTNSYTIPDETAEGTVYTVRAANEMGGLGLSSNEYIHKTTAIDDVQGVQKKVVEIRYFTLQGRELKKYESYKGVIIVKTKYTDGTFASEKIFKN